MLKVLKRLKFIYSPTKNINDNLDIQIIPDFIDDHDEKILVDFANAKLKKFSYEPAHFDTVISNYRECLTKEMPLKDKIMDTLNRFHLKWQDFHILDLQTDGFIKHHLDHYAGPHICGLSLLSNSVMHFKKETEYQFEIDEFYAYLPRYSLYIQHGNVRKYFQHALYRKYDINFPSEWKLENKRRISILMRNPT
eukprot:NODE_115_length_18417_cov_0.666012.p14 type:complete len:194 gc:universal NODE_115_length_18417_cov_0.666012:13187-12606(-)